MKINEPTARLARWSIYLQAYDFEIVHRAGRVHSNVDVLSRPVVDINFIQTVFYAEVSLEKAFEMGYNWTGRDHIISYDTKRAV